SLARSFEIEEASYAAYLQADFETEVGGRTLDGQIGARYTGSQTDMWFYDTTNTDAPPATASADNSKLLPSIMLRYHITDDLMLRTAYTETLRLPNFSQLNANIIYNEDVTNIGYGTASGGNPDLEPTESQNVDISLEWYFAPSSSAYVT